MENKTVSIIIPVHNTAVFLKESIESVINQTYPYWEIILIDDNSIDNSLSIIEYYSHKDQRIKYFHNNERCGVAICRNKGIEIAQGFYVAFLDSDDIWDSDKLSLQIKFMEEKQADFTFTAYRKVYEKKRLFSKHSIPAIRSITYKKLLRSNFIGCLTVLVKKTALGDLRFQSNKHEDYTFWLQLAKKGIVMKGLNIPLASYRIRRNSITNKKYKVFLWQWYIYRKIEKLNIFKSIYFFIFYIYYGVRKYLLR